jgi:hypothetical protein
MYLLSISRPRAEDQPGVPGKVRSGTTTEQLSSVGKLLLRWWARTWLWLWFWLWLWLRSSCSSYSPGNSLLLMQAGQPDQVVQDACGTFWPSEEPPFTGPLCLQAPRVRRLQTHPCPWVGRAAMARRKRGDGERARCFLRRRPRDSRTS